MQGCVRHAWQGSPSQTPSQPTMTNASSSVRTAHLISGSELTCGGFRRLSQTAAVSDGASPVSGGGFRRRRFQTAAVSDGGGFRRRIPCLGVPGWAARGPGAHGLAAGRQPRDVLVPKVAERAREREIAVHLCRSQAAVTRRLQTAASDGGFGRRFQTNVTRRSHRRRSHVAVTHRHRRPATAMAVACGGYARRSHPAVDDEAPGGEDALALRRASRLVVLGEREGGAFAAEHLWNACSRGRSPVKCMPSGPWRAGGRRLCGRAPVRRECVCQCVPMSMSMSRRAGPGAVGPARCAWRTARESPRLATVRHRGLTRRMTAVVPHDQAGRPVARRSSSIRRTTSPSDVATACTSSDSDHAAVPAATAACSLGTASSLAHSSCAAHRAQKSPPCPSKTANTPSSWLSSSATTESSIECLHPRSPEWAQPATTPSPTTSRLSVVFAVSQYVPIPRLVPRTPIGAVGCRGACLPSRHGLLSHSAHTLAPLQIPPFAVSSRYHDVVSQYITKHFITGRSIQKTLDWLFLQPPFPQTTLCQHSRRPRTPIPPAGGLAGGSTPHSYPHKVIPGVDHRHMGHGEFITADRPTVSWWTRCAVCAPCHAFT